MKPLLAAICLIATMALAAEVDLITTDQPGIVSNFPMNKTLVFCDVDGVLNSIDSGSMFPNDPNNYRLNETNVLALIKLCKAVNGRVVIHSGWNKRALDSSWEYRGKTYQSLLPTVTNRLGFLCIGITKHNEGTCKAEEILNWVSTNTVECIVLDDDMSDKNKWHLLKSHPNIHFYNVSPSTGFTTNDLNKIRFEFPGLY